MYAICIWHQPINHVTPNIKWLINISVCESIEGGSMAINNGNGRISVTASGYCSGGNQP